MPDCLLCDGDGEHAIPTGDGEVYACPQCWDQRYQNGVEEWLAQRGVLTTKLVAELQARFYDETQSTEGGAFTERAAMLTHKAAAVTTIRQGYADTLAAIAGVGETGEAAYFDAVQWPGLEPEATAHAMLVFLPVDADVDVFSGAFVAGKELADVDRQLSAVIDNYPSQNHG